ncbi:hypothetical protein D1Z97_01300 [Riemerella anatipestifer]|uniref:hypothetical protein n=1 Tax=Riemerella anatipestifer TaxID=34085 RepID=UPI00129DE725|nr:hypothetical protein [Riemerella anatipestifer]MRM96819.1 hypothetical protein [Riemerella anatipestifer]MRM99850.1 hypothetical protein [Riemerella anatipestifer]MRN01788.1 hypothetical protein [Riemerella anatipestifer]
MIKDYSKQPFYEGDYVIYKTSSNKIYAKVISIKELDYFCFELEDITTKEAIETCEHVRPLFLEETHILKAGFIKSNEIYDLRPHYIVRNGSEHFFNTLSSFGLDMNYKIENVNHFFQVLDTIGVNYDKESVISAINLNE